jgi:hypothetical protein
MKDRALLSREGSAQTRKGGRSGLAGHVVAFIPIRRDQSRKIETVVINTVDHERSIAIPTIKITELRECRICSCVVNEM